MLSILDNFRAIYYLWTSLEAYWNLNYCKCVTDEPQGRHKGPGEKEEDRPPSSPSCVDSQGKETVLPKIKVKKRRQERSPFAKTPRERGRQ